METAKFADFITAAAIIEQWTGVHKDQIASYLLCEISKNVRLCYAQFYQRENDTIFGYQ